MSDSVQNQKLVAERQPLSVEQAKEALVNEAEDSRSLLYAILSDRADALIAAVRAESAPVDQQIGDIQRGRGLPNTQNKAESGAAPGEDSAGMFEPPSALNVCRCIGTRLVVETCGDCGQLLAEAELATLRAPQEQEKEHEDEEMQPHVFRPRSHHEIWCDACEYHRDHKIHVSPPSPAPAEDRQPRSRERLIEDAAQTLGVDASTLIRLVAAYQTGESPTVAKDRQPAIQQGEQKNDLGGVSPTEVAAVSCLVHADQLAHVESLLEDAIDVLLDWRNGESPRGGEQCPDCGRFPYEGHRADCRLIFAVNRWRAWEKIGSGNQATHAERAQATPQERSAKDESSL